MDIQTKQNLSQPSSFRIDKYLVNDIRGFNVQVRLQEEQDRMRDGGAYDCDDRLVRNIIYSIANDYEHSLFNFGQLDPARFAKQWNYDAGYLRHRVENPYQLTHMTQDEIAAYRQRLRENNGCGDSQDGRVWDTQLENALYILSSRPISFERYGEFAAAGGEGKESVEVKSHATFTLLSGLSAIRRERGKTIYTYTLNENFEKNLTRYYIRGEVGSLISLRSCGLDSLYLYLVNLKNNLGLAHKHATTPGELPDMDYLCRLADISFTTKDGGPVPEKTRKYQLMRALERIDRETDLDMTVTWVGDGGEGLYSSRGAYVPVIDFGAASAVTTDTSWGYGKNAAEGERTAIQRQLITKSFLDMYKKLFTVGSYMFVDPADFNRWALDGSCNRKEKETALRLALIGIFHELPKNEDAIIRSFFRTIGSGAPADFSQAISSFSI